MPKNKSRTAHVKRAKVMDKGNVVHTVFDAPAIRPQDWHPLEEDIENARDKSYIRKIKPRSDGQRELMEAIKDHSLTLALGPAGSGKTYLAISAAVEALDEGKIERIILSRPAMEAGESIGFLPGDMHEKMAPYLRPLYDALGDRMGGRRVRTLLQEGTIEIAPVGFMRGQSWGRTTGASKTV